MIAGCAGVTSGGVLAEIWQKTACDVSKRTAGITSGDGGRKNGFFATLRMTEYLALRMTGPREVFRLDGTFPPPVSPEVLVDGPPKAKGRKMTSEVRAPVPPTTFYLINHGRNHFEKGESSRCACLF